MAEDRPALIDAYWTHYRWSFSADATEGEATDDVAWAWLAASDLDPDDRSITLLVDLAEAAPDDEARAYLGAGPLEHLLLEHGPSVVDAVERAAQRSEAFRTALRCVWLDGGDPAVVERLRRFGPPL